MVDGLSKSYPMSGVGDLMTLHKEANSPGADGTDRVILLTRDLGRNQLLNTQLPFGAGFAARHSVVSTLDIGFFGNRQGQIHELPIVSSVYAPVPSGEYRIAVAIPLLEAPKDEVLISPSRCLPPTFATS